MELDPIIHLLPKEQVEDICKEYAGDIDVSFLGFTQIYKNLSEIIPKHFTVIDFGCGYNPQCFLFQEHKRFIAVNPDMGKVFKTSTCELYNMTTGEYIEKHLHEHNIEETFAICAYVPPWYGEDSIELVRHNFKNVFTYYPHGGFEVFMKAPTCAETLDE